MVTAFTGMRSEQNKTKFIKEKAFPDAC